MQTRVLLYEWQNKQRVPKLQHNFFPERQGYYQKNKQEESIFCLECELVLCCGFHVHDQPYLNYRTRYNAHFSADNTEDKSKWLNQWFYSTKEDRSDLKLAGLHADAKWNSLWSWPLRTREDPRLFQQWDLNLYKLVYTQEFNLYIYVFVHIWYLYVYMYINIYQRKKWLLPFTELFKLLILVIFMEKTHRLTSLWKDMLLIFLGNLQVTSPFRPCYLHRLLD